MAKRSTRRKYTRNEKIFYILSLLIVFSMVFASIALLFDSGGGGAIGTF
ncbi:MAG: hypothetical protein AAF702_42550 [Chloroflexota bacterium]